MVEQIVDATQFTGTITVANGALKCVGNSTIFGKFRTRTNELLRAGDFVFVVNSGVGQLREVDYVDDGQQIFYVKNVFESALTTQSFWRVPKEFFSGVRFPSFTLASNYSVEFYVPGRSALNIEANFASLNASDGVLKVQTANTLGSAYTDVTGASITVASSDTNHTINMDGFTVGRWVRVVFTRNSVSAGTIRVNFFKQ